MADRLLNGQFGLMFDFAYINSSITKVYVKLDDQKGSKNAMSKTCMLQSIKLCQFRQLKQILSSVKIIQSMGLTLLYSTVVSLQLIRERPFSPGQIYLANVIVKTKQTF